MASNGPAASSEDWKLCVDWLVRSNVLPRDHESTLAEAEVVHLAQSLRDGVLLCHLLNVLSPECIDTKDFSQRPQMSQFLCLKNIRTFLQTCKEKFGLKEGELFDSYELFDMRNFGKVITTLSKLSKTQLANLKVQRGFPPNEELQYHDYKNLEDLMSDIQDLEINRGIYDTDEEDDHEDKIYDTIVCGGSKDGKGQAVALPPSPTAPAKSKRDFCIKELVETENNYVDALNMIISHFMRPLKTVLPQMDRDIIFKYIEDLAQVHTGFHSELHKACTTGTSKISECFIKWKSKFLIYSDFCSHLPRAQEHIEEVSKNDTVNQNILECQRKAKDGKFRLRDLLLVPMQRVLKYHLLLKELIKYTDPDQDREGLQKALDAMEDLSAYVNEVKRDNERLHLINEIQLSITELTWPDNTFLKDYGRLQKDGELRVRSHEDNKPKTRYVFLFDRVMLMCKAKMMDKILGGEVYGFKNCLILSNYKIDQANNVPLKKEREKWSNPFLLVEKNQANAITFLTKTEDQRRAWIEALRIALDNNQPPGYRDNGHEFVMQIFDKPTECSVCKRLLRGIFFQGYQCKNTDMKVHKECIRKASMGPGNLPPRPPVGPPPVPKQSIGKVKATCNYRGNPAPPNGQVPLFFESNDMLDLLQRNNDWLEGRRGNVEGWFPRSFVRDTRQTSKSYIDHSNGLRSPGHRVKSPGPQGDGLDGLVRTPSAGSTKSHHSYVNLADLCSFPWYVGPMSREDADKALEQSPCGTFLIRESTNHNRKGQHALSIKYGGCAKHIRVFKNKDQYYIADIKYFKSIPELVEFYQRNSLADSFNELNTTLVLPMKESQKTWNQRNSIKGYATASFDFAATAVNQLSLRKGDKVAIISKLGGDKGWWKGALNGKIGYFPCAYVKEDEVHVDDDCD